MRLCQLQRRVAVLSMRFIHPPPRIPEIFMADPQLAVQPLYHATGNFEVQEAPRDSHCLGNLRFWQPLPQQYLDLRSLFFSDVGISSALWYTFLML